MIKAIPSNHTAFHLRMPIECTHQKLPGVNNDETEDED
jgi:hypothetical protein